MYPLQHNLIHWPTNANGCHYTTLPGSGEYWGMRRRLMNRLERKKRMEIIEETNKRKNHSIGDKEKS